MGKYLPSFQQRINGDHIRVEHSICGAIALRELMGDSLFSLMGQLCIAGHHSGLPDVGTSNDSADASTLKARLERKTGDFSAYKSELSLKLPPMGALVQFFQSAFCGDPDRCIEKYAFLVRYCYSCLVDADSVDTRTFCDNQDTPPPKADFSVCEQLVQREMAGFHAETPLQKARSRVQTQVYQYADCEGKIKLMNLPTGSGKTLGSIRYALMRALKTGRKRIIYVAPMNAIIDQTAVTFEKLFGDKAQIVRHQSTFSYDDLEDMNEDERTTMKCACENWDCPIVITTAVQFFESIYSNRRGKLRKLHNMGDSVILLDEAHMMPVEYLQPCLQAIAHITETLNSEAVLLTATMPDYQRLFHTFVGEGVSVQDIAPDKSSYEYFRKFTCRDLGQISEEALIAKSGENASALVIVNTRKRAKALYQACPVQKKYHLSTYMTAFDRMRVIEQVKKELDALRRDYPCMADVPPERRVLLFSTSLVEAGVDVDFSAVYRELTGLDSVLQSGGRCNREGRLKQAFVYVFTFEDGRKYAALEPSITKNLLHEYDDVSSPQCITDYYDRLLYTRDDQIISHTLSRQCKSIKLIPFKTYAESFRFIEDKTVSIFVPVDEESRSLHEILRFTGKINVRKIQKYLSAVYQNEFENLLLQGVLEDYGSGVYCLTNMDYYRQDIGIQLEGQDKFL